MEQLEHFPFPFDTQADALPAEEEPPSGPDSTDVNVTIDLRRCLHTAVTHPYTRGAVPPATNAYAPAQEGEAASDAVRSLWVWPPSKRLATFVLRWCQENAAQSGGDVGQDSNPLNILELGAGTGVCGLFASRLLGQLRTSARVWLTDLNPASLQLLALNAAANAGAVGGRSVSIGRLRWGDTAIEPHTPSAADEASPPATRDGTAATKRRKVERPAAAGALQAGAEKKLESPSTAADHPDSELRGFESSPPGRRGFSLIMASDIIVEDEAIDPVWRTVDHYLAETGLFVMACAERPTLVFSRGQVSEEAVDTTLKAFVEAAASVGFEAGEDSGADGEAGEEPQPPTATGEGQADGGAAGGRVRTFVFCRAKRHV